MPDSEPKTETAASQAASDCLGPVRTPSFACMWEVVNRFRNGQLDVELARIIVGQVDAALSQMDTLPEVSTQEYTVDAVERLANVLPDTDADVQAAGVPWSLVFSLLIELAGRLR